MEVSIPSVVHNLDAPQLVLGVTSPSEDDHAVERDFADSAMEERFAPSIDQGSNREEIVHEAW
jgi:hypothetical protein